MKKQNARLVRVSIREEDGHFIATSPDVTGLLVIDESLGVVLDELPGLIEVLIAANEGLSVQVQEVDLDNTRRIGIKERMWVAIPPACTKTPEMAHA